MPLSHTGDVSTRISVSGLLVGASLWLAAGTAFGQQAPVDPIPPAPDGVKVIPHNPRATELWKDKSLGNLKASIDLGLPADEQLSPLEVARLNQATPFLADHGSHFSVIGDSRPWLLATYEWEAPATRHLPLLFEEPNLERLGYTYGCRTWWCGEEGSIHASDCLQPFISGAHFFGRVPLIPYMIGMEEPCACEPIYTLGVDHPGTPTPYRRHYLPLSLKGAVYQAAATVGMLYIFP